MPINSLALWRGPVSAFPKNIVAALMSLHPGKELRLRDAWRDAARLPGVGLVAQLVRARA